MPLHSKCAFLTNTTLWGVTTFMIFKSKNPEMTENIHVTFLDDNFSFLLYANVTLLFHVKDTRIK